MFWYYFYNLATMPGVVVHELSHAFFCVFSGVKIRKTKLFQLGGTVAGYVVHDEPQKFWQGFFITLGPLIINSAVATFLFSFVVAPWARSQPWVMLWLGVAIGLHAIPSTGDAKSLFQMTNHRFWHNPLVVIAYPFVLILYILNLLKRLKIDFLFVGLLYWLGRYYLKG
jgi:hypothetical protein